jgi:YggT family protein
MISDALEFLLQTVLGLFTLAVLLRFYLQLTGAPFQNPASQAVVALTNFAVRPLRRIVPGWGGLDFSTLILAYTAQLLLQLGTLWLRDFPLLVAGDSVWIALLGLALTGLLKLSIYIFLYAVLLQAILSWVNPYTAITAVLDALTRPLLRPLQKRMPATGGIDLSPLIVFIGAELLLMLCITPLEQQFLRLF